MSAPDITEADIDAVVEVLRSGQLSMGPWQEGFEALVASYVGTSNAVAVSSGTAALHLLMQAVGIGPGDEVLVPSFTFAASVNCILYQAATPVFVDIEPDTYNIDPSDLERKVTAKTRAVVVVDAFGHPADWDSIEAIARRHRLRVIDDSCEALGACYRSRPIGQFGDAAAFAFYPNKQITTGEGGMIVTNDAAIAEACRSLRNHGRNHVRAWLEHERLGYNYRMDEMSAALGVSQMRRLDEILAKRSDVAAAYAEELARVPWLRPPAVRPDVAVSWFVYVVTLIPGIDRERLVGDLESQGIAARAYFGPMHLQAYLKSYGLPDHDGKHAHSGDGLPVTDDISRRTLALPFHTNLSAAQIRRVVEGLERAVELQGWAGKP